MTDVQQDLRDALIANATVAGLVGSGSPIAYRIHPAFDDFDIDNPCIIYQHVGGVPENQLNGAALATSHRIQIDCYADSPAGARDLADAVEAALVGNGYIIFRLDDQLDPNTSDWFTQLDWKKWK